jgi:hypothetical protein
MRTTIAVIAAAAAPVAVALAAAPARATFGPCPAQPVTHCTYQAAYEFVDTATCGFAVTGHFVFTNDITDLFDEKGVERQLQLHQSNVGTYAANGVTLRETDRYTIIVDFENGVPVTAKHVGDLDEIIGPGGPIFHRTGLDEYAVVFDPSSGFYVDGPRILRHGLRDNFDPAKFCAALGG